MCLPSYKIIRSPHIAGLYPTGGWGTGYHSYFSPGGSLCETTASALIGLCLVPIPTRPRLAYLGGLGGRGGVGEGGGGLIVRSGPKSSATSGYRIHIGRYLYKGIDWLESRDLKIPCRHAFDYAVSRLIRFFTCSLAKNAIWARDFICTARA